MNGTRWMLLKNFDTLDWLARLTTYIPDKAEQMVRSYGDCSNTSRGKRKKAGMGDQAPALIVVALSSTAFRRNWAAHIQKI